MSTAIVPSHGNAISAGVLEKVLLQGDLASLNSQQRIEYMTRVCDSLGLNPLTKPFEFLTFQGKMVMYARRDCTEQLRKLHAVSVTIAAREVTEGCYIVTARAQDGAGRHDESIGAVTIDGLKGEARSNAMMKAETKAKRRVTLSICGLGMLDESEADSIPGARVAPDYTPPAKEAAPAVGKGPPVFGSPASATSGPTGATQTSPVATTTTTPIGQTTGTSSPKDYVPANKVPVKAGDPPINPGQIERIHVLQKQFLDEQTYRLTWLNSYKTHAGVKCESSKDLTFDQAANLIKRMTSQAAKREQRAEAAMNEVGPVLVSPPPAPRAQTPRNLEDELTRAFQFADDERAWLRNFFGVEAAKELSKAQAETAIQLLLTWGTPLHDEAETSARERGLIR